MIVNFLEIEDGAVLKGELEGMQFKSADDNEFAFVSPISHELHVRKFENGINLTGPVTCLLSFSCSRCLEQFRYTLCTDMDIDIIINNSNNLSNDVELKGEELDVYYFNNNEIDLNPLVYEEVILNVPMKPLCKDECKGICSMCGKNLNNEACNCDKSPETPLGEKLKSFLSFQGDNHGSSKTKNISVKKG